MGHTVRFLRVAAAACAAVRCLWLLFLGHVQAAVWNQIPPLLGTWLDAAILCVRGNVVAPRSPIDPLAAVEVAARARGSHCSRMWRPRLRDRLPTLYLRRPACSRARPLRLSIPWRDSRAAGSGLCLVLVARAACLPCAAQQSCGEPCTQHPSPPLPPQTHMARGPDFLQTAPNPRPHRPNSLRVSCSARAGSSKVRGSFRRRHTPRARCSLP